MARQKKNENLTIEEKLEAALVPEDEQPYEVPGNWCWVKVSAISEFERGITFPASAKEKEKTKDNIPCLRTANIQEELKIDDLIYVNESYVKSNEKYVRKNDIIMSSANSRELVGKVSYVYDVPFPMTFGGFVLGIRAKGIYAKYLFYDLRYEFLCGNFMGESTQTTNIANINTTTLGNYKFPLPPLTEQHRIVDRIESLFAQLDEARDKAQEALDSFEERKAAVLQAAFLGTLIQTDTRGVIPLSEIADEIHIGPFGSALHKEDYIIGGVPVINPKHIVSQKIVPDNTVTISEDKAKELCSYRVKENDIILGRRGEMGRSAPVTKEQDGWLCGTGSMIIRLKNGYDGEFYSQIIASEPSVRYLEENAVGSTMSNLNEKIIKNLPIPDYSIQEQKKMTEILSKIIKEEKKADDVLEMVIEQVDLCKKAVLAKAFRGELGTNDPDDDFAIEALKKTIKDI